MSGHGVFSVGDVSPGVLTEFLTRYGLELAIQPDDTPIHGSFWGDSEAGIVGNAVYVRRDTPVHSLLHETCHLVCMDEARRAGLHTDAGGDDLEEAAVCYLQIVLAEYLEGLGSARLTRDMDTWGYSFRLGSTARWFADDADDARAWLVEHGILTDAGLPTWQLRS